MIVCAVLTYTNLVFFFQKNKFFCKIIANYGRDAMHCVSTTEFNLSISQVSGLLMI